MASVHEPFSGHFLLTDRLAGSASAARSFILNPVGPQAFRDGRRNATEFNPISTRARLSKVVRVEFKAHRKFSALDSQRLFEMELRGAQKSFAGKSRNV